MTTVNSALDGFWSTHVGDAPPVPWSLRDVCRARWLRFHSLPAGKRYATTAAETEEVLRRHNTVLDQLARRASHVFLITAACSGLPSGASRDPVVQAMDPTAKPWRWVAMHELERDMFELNYLHLFASEWDWRPGVFDALLRLVAEDRVANVMMVFDLAGCIYHPYDGGADVVLDTVARRDEWKATWSRWLSDREDGL